MNPMPRTHANRMPYSWCARPMIGFVPRERPTITVQSYDERRQFALSIVDREHAIEMIVSHLREAVSRRQVTSLRAMYRTRF